jgi:hypothetical protein
MMSYSHVVSQFRTNDKKIDSTIEGLKTHFSHRRDFKIGQEETILKYMPQLGMNSITVYGRDEFSRDGVYIRPKFIEISKVDATGIEVVFSMI